MTDPNQGEPEGLHRWRRRLVYAGRWAFDVFRGHARGRHLDDRRE
ncbi:MULTISPECIES: hypothetical protein [Halostella]|nr:MULTISPECIES: hypothetical protein [Halostella]